MLGFTCFYCLQNLRDLRLDILANDTFKLFVWFLQRSHWVYYSYYVPVFYQLLVEFLLADYLFLEINDVSLGFGVLCGNCTKYLFVFCLVELMLPFYQLVSALVLHLAHLTFVC